MNPVTAPFKFRYLNDAPLVGVDSHPGLGGNVNGPTLIKAPAWLENPPAKYLLYFAHHLGRSIRLAVSDSLLGPWQIHSPNPLELSRSRFATETPKFDALDPQARAYIDAGDDGDYPHIASPEAWIDDENQQIRLYYHGRMANGLQRTRVALSSDGVNFEAQAQVLTLPYLRVFKLRGWFYAIAMPAQLYRSCDGIDGFVPGPQLLDESIRHHDVLVEGDRGYVVWSRVGDCPERLLISHFDSRQDWTSWRLSAGIEVHRARKPWEGGDLPVEASVYGACMKRVNQLRDPAIYREAEKIYLLYAVAGEQGIAIGELNETWSVTG